MGEKSLTFSPLNSNLLLVPYPSTCVRHRSIRLRAMAWRWNRDLAQRPLPYRHVVSEESCFLYLFASGYATRCIACQCQTLCMMLCEYEHAIGTPTCDNGSIVVCDGRCCSTPECGAPLLLANVAIGWMVSAGEGTSPRTWPTAAMEPGQRMQQRVSKAHAHVKFNTGEGCRTLTFRRILTVDWTWWLRSSTIREG